MSQQEHKHEWTQLDRLTRHCKACDKYEIEPDGNVFRLPVAFLQAYANPLPGRGPGRVVAFPRTA